MHSIASAKEPCLQFIVHCCVAQGHLFKNEQVLCMPESIALPMPPQEDLLHSLFSSLLHSLFSSLGEEQETSCLLEGLAPQVSALGKWGWTQMGSDGFNRIVTGFCLFSTVRVRLVPLKTHDFKGFRLDFDGISA